MKKEKRMFKMGITKALILLPTSLYPKGNKRFQK